MRGRSSAEFWPLSPGDLQAVVVHLVGAILLEQNDERVVQHCRYMTLESVDALSDDPLVSLPILAA